MAAFLGLLVANPSLESWFMSQYTEQDYSVHARAMTMAMVLAMAMSYGHGMFSGNNLVGPDLTRSVLAWLVRLCWALVGHGCVHSQGYGQGQWALAHMAPETLSF